MLARPGPADGVGPRGPRRETGTLSEAVTLTELAAEIGAELADGPGGGPAAGDRVVRACNTLEAAGVEKAIPNPLQQALAQGAALLDV